LRLKYSGNSHHGKGPSKTSHKSLDIPEASLTSAFRYVTDRERENAEHDDINRADIKMTDFNMLYAVSVKKSIPSFPCLGTVTTTLYRDDCLDPMTLVGGHYLEFHTYNSHGNFFYV
jgi:hypothetical protein